MTPARFGDATSVAVAFGVTIRQKTWCSRTRRAISCEN
jgi:hypothetical protein